MYTLIKLPVILSDPPFISVYSLGILRPLIPLFHRRFLKDSRSVVVVRTQIMSSPESSKGTYFPCSRLSKFRMTSTYPRSDSPSVIPQT